MAGRKPCTPHPILHQGPQKMRLHILCKGVSARAGPGNSCWGHGISRPWKLSKSQETSLGRGTWPAGHMHHRKQDHRGERVITPISLSCWGSTLLPPGSQIMPGSWHDCNSAGCHTDAWLWTEAWDFQDEVKLCWFYIRNGTVPGMDFIYTGRTQSRTKWIKVLAY